MHIDWAYLTAKGLAFIPALLAALVILVVGLWAGTWGERLVTRLLRRREADPNVTLLLGRLTRWGVIALGLVMALQQVGFNITALLTGVGAMGFALGFAVQDVSKNLIAGILLLMQQPFRIGEVIEVNGYSGTVEDITLRATALRTFDGRLVYVPNAEVFTSAIVNFSRTRARRAELTVGVAYGTGLEQAKNVALQALFQVKGVEEEPAPKAVFHTFNDSSIDMTLYFWVEMDETGLWDAKDEALRAVYRAFAQAGIEIPFPIRTVYLTRDAARAETPTRQG